MSDDKDLEIEARLLSGLLANTHPAQGGRMGDERLAELARLAVQAAAALRRAASEDKEDG